MWTAFEIAVNLFQAILLLAFMQSRLHITRKHKIHDVALVTSCTIYLSSYLFFHMPLPDTLAFTFPFIYALAVADDPWYVSAFWSAVLALLFVSIITLFYHVFLSIPKLTYDELMMTGWGRLAFVLFTNILLTVMVYAMSKLKKNYTAPHWPVLALLLASITALWIVANSLYTIQIRLEAAEDTGPFFLSYIGLLLCIMFFILLFQIMGKSFEREQQYQAEGRALDQAKQYQQELERMYKDLRVKKHDFKHHYQAMEAMVLQGKAEEANNYLTAYQQIIDKDDFFLTGSTAVDSLLYAKSLTMKQQGIVFRYSPYSLDRLPISETDFCAVIGNLLDNAIEGTLRVSNTASPMSIILTFSRSWDMFYIYCVNPCNEQTIHQEKGIWRSSKNSPGNSKTQAIGIRNMERIVQAYQGRSAFTADNGVFSAKIVLPYPASEKERVE